MESLYLYLARRDKKGIRILTVLSGKQSGPVRVTDLKTLQLPTAMEREIAEAITDNRMYWEPWIEPASSYQDLSDKLTSRGYSGFPLHHRSAITKYGTQKANTSLLPDRTVMVQRSRNPS